MLRWRITLGILFGSLLVLLCWLDAHASIHGIYLMPLCLLVVGFATHEVLDLLEGAGMRPLRKTVYFANYLIAISSWLACLWRWGPEAGRFDRSWESCSTACVWTLMALSAGILVVFYCEMRRFVKPGGATINLAGAVFSMTYVGMMIGFLVQLRMAWGVLAVISVILVVKMSDIGAYTVGRLIGRNKMAPDLSPGKTIEGAFGGIAFAILASWFILSVVPDYRSSWVGIITYGLAVGMAGMAGDLAESLIKRDAQQKDSSRWMPGFGGVLDLVDSVLLAAPVAYAWWTMGLVADIARDTAP